jgi:nitric oxide reductase subunit B
MQQPLVDLLVWLRVPGDTIFAIGALILVVFIAGLWIFPRREDELPVESGEKDARARTPSGSR